MTIMYNMEKLIFLFILTQNWFHLSTCLHKQYLLDLIGVLSDPKRYDRNLYAPTVNYSAIRIDVNVDVQDLRDVSELTMTFRTEIYFTQTWNDPRLYINETYAELIDFTTLNPDYLSMFWKPDTFFSNVLASQAPPKDDDSFTHKNYLAVNGKGDVSFSQRLSLTAACWMQLQKYPFDHQFCKITLESYGIIKKNLEYKWNKVQSVHLADISLPDFKLLNVTTRESVATYDENSYSRLSLCFLLERKTSFYFMELYIPAILIVVSAWLATVGNTSGFSDILAVLLAMLFLYFSYITVMPKVSDVKAMDVFLMGCFGFIFFALLQTFINTEEEKIHSHDPVKPMEFSITNVKVLPYSDVQIDDYLHQKKVKKTRNVTKTVKLDCFQTICKYVTCRNFFLYAIYPTAFILFCFFYFITYMNILKSEHEHDYENADC